MKSTLTVFLMMIVSIASANTQIGRYTTVDNSVSLSQSDPLKQTFQIKFPASIQTVGDAVSFILMNTGYQFIAPSKQKLITKQLLGQQLPLPVRAIGPITVEEGLLALSGNTYQLVVDPAHRLVTYRLKPEYEEIYGEQN